MKQTTNQFTKGLITELHPLMTNGTQLTDALNATMITYNGNEFMLQNDMGNTLIQDSTTGHIMGLSEGFTPVGLKEHGGIIYIVSADKEGNGEIGTIPSPVLTLNFRTDDFNDSVLELCTCDGPKIFESIISKNQIFPGEKFIVMLNLKNSISEIQLPDSDITKPLISKIDEKGLYAIELYTVTSNSTISLINKCREAQQYVNSNGLQTSEYWFINGIDDTINSEQTYEGNCFKTYPGNIPSGRLAIKVKLENISSFGFIKSTQPLSDNQEEELEAPKIHFDSVNRTYHLLFPGFQYTTDSARYVKKVKMSVYNQLTGEVFSDLNNSEFIFDEISGITRYVNGVYELRNIDPNKPLVDISIGSVLNQWIKVKVEQYDQYDGKIDTLTYSFNPQHIINYQNLFFNPQLVPTVTTQQYYNISNSESDIPLNQLHFPISPSIKLMANEQFSFSWGQDGDSINDFVKYVDYSEQSESYYPVITSFIGNEFHPTVNFTPKEFIIPALNLKYLSNPIPVTYTYTTPDIEVSFNSRGVISRDIDSKSTPIINVGLGSKFKYSGGCKYDETTQYPEYGDTLVLMSDDTTPICIVNQYTQFGGIGSLTQQSEEDSIFEYNKFVEIDTHGTSFVGNGGYSSESYSKITQWDEGSRTVTISMDDNPNLLDILKYADGQSFPNKSIYQVHEGFEIYAEDEEGEQMLIGFDKNGKAKQASTLGSNLINETISFSDTLIKSSLYSNKKYLSENSNITKILNKGIYLLCFNYGFFGYGSATIKISDKSYSAPAFNNIIEPVLIYIPKKSKVEIFWNNLHKLQNIGLYEINSTIKYLNDVDITTEEQPIVISYHDDNIKTEIILPAQLTYEEYANCYQEKYDYYCGTKEPYYLDQIVYTNKNGEKVSESLIYKFDDNSEDLTETQILSPILLENLGLTKTIKYRIINELS